MDSMNHNQGFPDQNPGSDPNRTPEQNKSQDQVQNQNQFQGQNPGQYQGQRFDPYTGQPIVQTNPGAVNPETGNTYWENQNAGQNPAGEQGTPMQETPAQFYQYYQQQMGSNNNVPQQSMTQLEPPKKKSHKKTVAAAIVLVLILGIAGTAFAFKDKILNALSIGSKSPQEYYASVEQQAMNESIDKLMASTNKTGDDLVYHLTADLSYDKATLNSVLSGYAGMTIEDLESTIGIPLDSIGIDMTAALKDSTTYGKILLNLNKVDLISAEVIIDAVTQEMLMRIPELSPAYLKQSLMSKYGAESFNYEEYLNNLKGINPEDTADFLKRYSKIITSEIQEVELSKNEELTVGDTTETCNLLTVTIDEETLLDIVSAIIAEAKNDKFILDLLPAFDLSKDEYVSALENASDELKSSTNELTSDGKIIMEVYVKKDGKIIGRKFSVKAEGDKVADFGYALASKGKQSEYELYIDDEYGTRVISVTGTQTEKDDAYTGEATLEINAEDAGYDSYSFDISYEDVKTESKNNQVFYYGKINVSSLLMIGMDVGLEYNVEGKVQHTRLSLNMGTASLVALDFTSEYLDDYKIPSTDSSAEVYDIYDIEGYESTMDIDRLISDLSAKLGIDVQSIVDAYMPYY